MTLTNGTRLGPYEIQSTLGAGGMGEVYRAHDTRLSRDVAIKILPDVFAADPDRLARFEREAKTLASLNHPNIAHIHGLEESNGTRALVIELVEGEDLAQRLTRGPIPLDEALPIARQIADALEAAHESNIIHRDLKPANIKLRPDGAVKVLDFGLAKATSEQHAATSVSRSPTITSPALATHAGIILGTAAYMSPEQARGKPVDKRTDIWAFGCVLYEMLTGHRAFAGEDVTETIAAIVRDEPDWGALPQETPTPITRLLRRCLEKDRKERVSDIGLARLEIKEALTTARGDLRQPTKPLRRGRERLAWAAACALTGAMTGLAVWTLRPISNGASEVSRVLLGVAPAERFASAGSAAGNSSRPNRTGMALSPDGKSLVFSGSRGGVQQLYIRTMSRLEAMPIPGTEGSSSPFFSPDGQWVGFWQGALAIGATGELKKVPLGGGPVVPLCKTAILSGASWGRNDTIVFSAFAPTSGVWQVSAAGGAPHALTKVDVKQGELSHRLPQMLPEGNAVVFTIQKAARRWEDAQIVVRSLSTGKQTVLIEGGADARYVPTGHLVYVRSGTLMAVPFDLARLAISGSPNAIIDGVMQDVNSTLATGDSGAAQFSVSDSGALVYLPGGIYPDVERSLVWVDRDGRAEPLAGPHRSFSSPRLSPDGERLSFNTSGTIQHVWIHEITRGTTSRLTTEGQNIFAIWTRDGKRLTYSSAITGAHNLFWKAADATGGADRLVPANMQVQIPTSWSSDGKTLAYIQNDPSSFNADIWVLNVNQGSAEPRAFLRTPFIEHYPEFSPNGHWLVYTSNESGRAEVYVQPYPGPGARRQVSTDGGSQPAWARNGRELFYTTLPASGALKMMAVDVAIGEGAFSPGTPRMIFEGRYGQTLPTRNYDVTADGQRFLMVQDKPGASATPITEMILVQNWFEELKRLVPRRNP